MNSLIVIASIGTLVAIVVLTYQSSVRKANEVSAVATLNAVRIAQAKYVDHKGQYGSFIAWIVKFQEVLDNKPVKK